MTSFATLLRREWLQNKFGWTVIVLLPLALALLVTAAGQIQFAIDDAEMRVEFAKAPALALALGSIVGTAAVTLAIAWLTVLVQVPGLARRDQQDRSIEFWLSLPTGHVPSLAAPMLAHWLIFPLAALGVGVVSGHLVALALVAKVAGLGAWFGLPWGTVWVALLATLLRVGLGFVLATLWLSPLILLVMAASAWLKRWGLPVVIVALVVVGNLLDKIYGDSIVWSTLLALKVNAAKALLGGSGLAGIRAGRGGDAEAALQAVPGWMASDALHALAALADPLLLGALAVSAACFAMLVARRQRGA